MFASVRRLQPRELPYEEALGSFRAGVLSDAIDGLRRSSSVKAVHLLARTWLRVGNAAEAFAALQQIGSVEGLDKAEHSILLAATLSRMGHHDAAHQAAEDAIVRAISSASAEHEAEAFYYRGLIAYSSGDFAAAESDAEAVTSVPESLMPTPFGHVMPLPSTYSRGYELLGAIARTQSRFVDQIAPTRRAYELACLGPDRWIEAFALSNLVIALCDIADADAVAYASTLTERVMNFEWTPDLSRKQHQVYDGLGTLAALAGDNVGAFRWYRRAAEAARGVEHRLVASLKRSFLAHELSQDVIAREELDHALDLADRIDWNAVPGDFRLQLLDIAITAAPTRTVDARTALQRYGAIQTPMSTLAAARHDPSVRGQELMAAGIVARHEGHQEKAVEFLTAALNMWRQLGFGWRSMQASLELAEMGVMSQLETAAQISVSRPQSWIGRRALRLLEQEGSRPA